MANFLFDIAVNATFTAGINWATASFKLVGISNGITPSASVQSHLSDIPSGVRLTSAVAISGQSFANRTFSFVSDVWPTLAAGATVTYALLYLDTGLESTSMLLYCCDQATNLPVTGTGAAVSFTPNQTTGVFSL